jgi:hypothetical protein
LTIIPSPVSPIYDIFVKKYPPADSTACISLEVPQPAIAIKNEGSCPWRISTPVDVVSIPTPSADVFVILDSVDQMLDFVVDFPALTHQFWEFSPVVLPPEVY